MLSKPLPASVVLVFLFATIPVSILVEFFLWGFPGDQNVQLWVIWQAAQRYVPFASGVLWVWGLHYVFSRNWG